jgi:tetratricopeptide (TPR) repeat protein
MLLWVVPAPAQQTDWQAEIRKLVQSQKLVEALVIAENELEMHPQDLEARGWRARLLAWTHRWNESEMEYLTVLESAPHDVDVLIGLADVLTWQGRAQEAIHWLERAYTLDPQRSEVHLRQGRILHALGRNSEAAAAYRQALKLDDHSREARSELDALRQSFRHEIRLGNEIDFFNFTGRGGSVEVGWQWRLNPNWSSETTTGFYERFGKEATRLGIAVRRRLSERDSLVVGAALARHGDIIPANETQLGYERAFRSNWKRLPVRALEASFRQRWLWFPDAQVAVMNPGMLLYLPKDWQCMFQGFIVRNRFPNVAVTWTASGFTRVSFPLNRQVRGHLFYGLGTEDFSFLDQLGRFSGRTWGGGLRWKLAPSQEISSFVSFQTRSQGRFQTILGIGYAFRF